MYQNSFCFCTRVRFIFLYEQKSFVMKTFSMCVCVCEWVREIFFFIFFTVEKIWDYTQYTKLWYCVLWCKQQENHNNNNKSRKKEEKFNEQTTKWRWCWWAHGIFSRRIFFLLGNFQPLIFLPTFDFHSLLLLWFVPRVHILIKIPFLYFN